MPIDKSPIVIKEFKGKLVTDVDPTKTALGEYEQIKIPFEYSLDNSNLEFLKKGGLRTRCGIERYVRYANATGKPVQFWKISALKTYTQTDRWLILTWDGATGRIYDTGSTVGNPILTVNTMKYAFVINAFSRIYISPWTGWANPMSSGNVYVYNGDYVARYAGCPLPLIGAPAFTAAVAAGGNCTPGVHLYSVLYETDTGYISSCILGHSLTPLTITTTAANATINFTNVPVAPAGLGVIKRHIIITKIVVNNNARGFNSYEPFFAVSILDNVTTVASFTGSDSSLLESAKNYIADGTAPNQLNATIPACISMVPYGNRLVLIGVEPTHLAFVPQIIYDQILISPPNRPEQIDTEEDLTSTTPYGYIGRSVVNMNAQFSGRAVAGGELSSTLYIFKYDSTFGIVADDTKDPNEWPDPVLIDSGKGAFPFGVSNIGNNPSSNNNGSLLVCGNHGITPFNGRFDQRSIAEGIWEEYKIADLKWAKVVVDPIRQLMFLRIGDPNSDNIDTLHGANTRILVANYYYGIDITSIRWGAWKYTVDHELNPLLTIADIDLREPNTAGNVGGLANFNTLYSLLCVLTRKSTAGLYDANIHSEAIADRDFLTSQGINGVFPLWFYETGYTRNNAGEIYTFGPAKLRVKVDAGGVVGGVNSNVTLEKAFQDSSTFITASQFAVGSTPGKFYSVNLNAYGECLRLRISGQNRVTLEELVLFFTETAKDRPRV